LKLGSLFDGIGGFPLVASRYKIKPVWASEIEPFPIKVTQHHFPNMKHLGDITQINGAEIEPVDIITFGSPCQDLSVAGKREGLQGERSGLFMDAVRIIREMRRASGGEYPRFIVWENVPGAFSSNGGQDIQVVLNELEKLGFVIDMNVLDAQYMGVPQRRRRIFALCISADFIRQMRTPTSLSIITQLLTEILLCILSEQLNLYEKEPKNSVWKQRKLTVDGLQRKMRLFSIETRENFEMLLNNWVETCQIHLSEPYCSESHSEKLDTTIKAATNKNEFLTEMELEKLFGSISRSWKELLDVLYYQGNSYITLTATKGTTNQIICGCANLLENMALLIGRLKNYCQNLYETELYISTARKVCIDYARERQTSITLFDGMEWLQCWDDYIRLHTETTEQFERYFTGHSAAEILLEQEGVRGDFAEGRKAWEEAAATVGDGVENASGIIPFDTTQITSPQNGNNPKPDGPCHPLCANAHVPSIAIPQPLIMEPRSQDGTCRVYEDGIVPTLNTAQGGQRQPCVITSQAIPIHDKATRYKGGGPTRKNDGAANGFGVGKPGDVMPTLGTGDRHAVAYPDPAHTLLSKSNLSFRDDQDTVVSVDCRNLYENKELSGTLQHKGSGGYSLNYQNPVRLGYVVRRLTPLECLRLQGYPDWWLDVEGMSDSAKYRAIGNSVAIPCVEYVLGGIVEALSCK